MDVTFKVFSAHLILKEDALTSEMSTIKVKVKTVIKELLIEHLTLEIGVRGESCNVQVISY